MKAQDIPSGLESLQLHKPSKSFPTYALLQKIWNKAKQLQQDTGFTSYRPIWHKNTYAELAKLHCGSKWITYVITHLMQIFANGTLLSFREML